MLGYRRLVLIRIMSDYAATGHGEFTDNVSVLHWQTNVSGAENVYWQIYTGPSAGSLLYSPQADIRAIQPSTVSDYPESELHRAEIRYILQAV